MRLLVPIVANLALLLSALGYGALLLRSLRLGVASSGIDSLALTLLGGLGLLGTLLFDIGQVLFSKTLVCVILAAGIVAAVASSRVLVKDLSEIIPKRRTALIPATIVVAVLTITAVGGLAEPVGDVRMDAIAYHFLGPKVWLRNGVIRPVPDEAFTAFPAIVETQYAALFAIGGERAPNFYAVISLLGIVLITGSLAVRSGLSPPDASWVLALIVCMPALYRGVYGGFVDALYSSFLLAAIRIGFDAVRASEFALFGIFCGFALGTKYTALIAVPILLAWAAFVAIKVHRVSVSRVFQYLVVACLAALIVAGPWYLRNWIVTGSPIYPPPPVLSRFFVVKYLPPEAISELHHAILQMGRGMGRDLSSFLLLPFHLTFHAANFLNGAGGIGLAPLALAPFGLLLRRKDWFAIALGSFAAVQTLAWFFTEQDVRFLSHVCVLAAIYAVWGWVYVQRGATRLAQRFAELAVLLSISYGLYMIGTARADDIHAVASPSFENFRIHQEVPFLDSFAYLNNEPSVAKILILDPFVPSFYLNKDYVKPVGRWGERCLPQPDNLEAIINSLLQFHVTHVLDVRDAHGQFRLGAHPHGLTLVFERADQRIYRVN